MTTAIEITAEDLIAWAEPHAAQLVCAVSDGDHGAVRNALEQLDRQQMYALAVVLAALVPDDAPLRPLLSERDLMLAAHAAYQRGERGEEVVEGERTYQRLKKRRHRQAKYGSAA